MAGKKISAAEVEARVIEVERLYLMGYTTREIYVLCKHWEVTNKTINNYISKAKQRTNEINKETVEETRDMILKNLWHLFQLAKDDSKEKHRLLLSIAKMVGLDKVHLNVNVTGERLLKNLSDSDLSKILEENEETDS
jgi:hypothetical protein